MTKPRKKPASPVLVPSLYQRVSCSGSASACEAAKG